MVLAAYKGVLKATLLGSLSIMRGVWLALFRRKALRMPRSALGYPIPYGAAIAAGTAAVWIYYRWPW